MPTPPSAEIQQLIEVDKARDLKLPFEHTPPRG